MKFFYDSSAAKNHIRPLSRSPPPGSTSTSTSKAKPKTVRPPSDDDDDEAEVPKKKPRKTRSDKGVKRVSTDEEGKEEKEVKKRGRPRKEPETYAAKAKAALKAKEKEKHRELLEEIEEEEEAEERERAGKVDPVAKAEKGKGKGKAKVVKPPDDEGEDDEIDWTEDERVVAEPKKDVKGKGKGKSKDLVVVGLELHANRASLSPPPAKKSKLAARPVAAANAASTDWLPRLSTDNYFDLSSDEREAFLDLLDKEDVRNRKGEVKDGGSPAGGEEVAKARKWRCATCGFDLATPASVVDSILASRRLTAPCARLFLVAAPLVPRLHAEILYPPYGSRKSMPRNLPIPSYAPPSTFAITVSSPVRLHPSSSITFPTKTQGRGADVMLEAVAGRFPDPRTSRKGVRAGYAIPSVPLLALSD
ncbi:hypothetical protein NBRC10512_003751 [Rhodotorula toruloides]|uniref:RHTO0S03e12970g1_1 n=2 Tax=Rhodotorula toruloides TaxID=5286 RepID=A0A061AVK1_RHOTO|nr:uncharacterized protein RHTO_00608 [Rhodotorula toruloides NP11]EMS26180.1 hypothetical protein RHTO_00608 [Rhodotorula toruloides NP11]CDR38761.1 RHTO0S03e12970g1_1 [Rhodotorula toruloides]